MMTYNISFCFIKGHALNHRLCSYDRLWAHCSAVYLITGFVCFHLFHVSFIIYNILTIEKALFFDAQVRNCVISWIVCKQLHAHYLRVFLLIMSTMPFCTLLFEEIGMNVN